jgi:hypothetical protein
MRIVKCVGVTPEILRNPGNPGDANMKRRSALFSIGIVGFILICAGGIIGLYYALERSGILSALLYIREARIRVLCKTDYGALLGACRELSDRASRGELKHKKYFVYPPPDPGAIGAIRGSHLHISHLPLTRFAGLGILATVAGLRRAATLWEQSA